MSKMNPKIRLYDSCSNSILVDMHMEELTYHGVAGLIEMFYLYSDMHNQLPELGSLLLFFSSL